MLLHIALLGVTWLGAAGTGRAPDAGAPPRVSDRPAAPGPRDPRWSGRLGARAAGGALPVQTLLFRAALRRALAANRDLRQARLDLAVARQEARAARGAYDPTLGAGISYGESTAKAVDELNIQTLRSSALRYDLSISQKLPTGGTLSLGWDTSRTTSLTRFNFSGTPFENDTETWETSLALTLTHPLLAGVGLDKNLAELRKARLARQAARWTVRAKAEAVVRDLLKAYLDVAAAQSAVQVEQRALRQAEADLARARALLAVGRLAEADLVDYQFAVAQGRRAVLEARTRWLEASLALRLLTGERLGAGAAPLVRVVVPAEVLAGPIPAAAAAARRAVAHSQALMAALSELKIREVDVAARRRDHWPALDLTASVGPQGRASDFGAAHRTMFKWESLSWSVGLTFSYLIGSRAARAAQEKARLGAAKQRIAVADLRQGLIAEVLRTVAALRLAERIVATSRAERDLARLRLENEQKRLAAGRSSLFVVLRLRSDLTRAEHKAETAALTLLKHKADLWALLGSLLGRLGVRERGDGAGQ